VQHGVFLANRRMRLEDACWKPIRAAEAVRDLDARTCSRCSQPELITLTSSFGQRSTVCLACDATPISSGDLRSCRTASIQSQAAFQYAPSRSLTSRGS
jgi:hypothetical protein